jgi:TonB-linked SusC/RagA family outer membrane protein
MMTLGRWRVVAATAAALMAFTAAARSAHAQGIIRGQVTSATTSQPLADARVIVIGGQAATTTGEDGRFALRGLNAGTVQLQVLHVGYHALKKTVTLADRDSATADFQLTVAVVQLQEVVTTATGQQRKSELGNAISTITDVGKKVEESKINTFADLITAKAPGVIVLPSTSLGGAPTVRIRGVSSISLSNAPIFVVDGVRYSAGATNSGTDTPFSLLNSLNPEEIEDIEIVKGPSAATLYGTNAANGVVVISTKKGRAGATRWNWFGELGNVDDRTNYQPMYANWGHAPGKTTPIRCQLATMGPSTCISDSLTSYNLMEDDSKTFVHMGRRNQYGVSVSGGNDAVRFFTSADIDNEYGPLQMPGFEVARFDSLRVPVRDEWFHPQAQQKASFRANLNASPSPKFDVSVQTGFSKNDNRIMPESDLIIALYYVGMQNYGFKGPGLDKTLTQNDGTPLNDFYQWAPGDIMQYTNELDVQRTTASTNASWRPISWLQNDGTVGIDLSNLDFFHICRLNECPPQSQTARVGNVTDNKINARNFSAKITSTATWNYKPWMNLKTSVGADYANLESDSLRTSGTTLPPGASRIDQSSTKTISSQFQPTAVKTLGFYVQEQASLHDRLFLTVAARTDQNSAFGTNFQRVLYPKASMSWIMSNESFFPRWSWLNEFRLRSSYGASGVQPGATSALITFTGAAVSIPTRGTTAGSDVPGLTAAQPGLPNLKPETSAELEAGFDTQVLNNRLRFEYTFYRKQTKDALVSVPLAPSSAASQLNVLQNVGSTRNTGHEVQMNAQLIDTRKFGWDVTVAGSHNTNLVVDLGLDAATGLPRVIGAGLQTRQISGLPLNGQWYRPYTYKDDNGDGILQVAEVHVDSNFAFRGYNSPRDLVSVQSGFDLFSRRLRINAAFDYKGGGNTVDGANNFQCTVSPFACQETQDPKAPLANQARAIAKTYGTVINGTTYKSSVGYFQPNQFWKFRELSAVLTLPNQVVNRLRAKPGSSLVFGARNLHVWTSFTGIDPEANYGLSGSENQNEFQTAAAPTYFTLRLNLHY